VDDAFPAEVSIPDDLWRRDSLNRVLRLKPSDSPFDPFQRIRLSAEKKGFQ
jgi:hypothetical protein